MSPKYDHWHQWLIAQLHKIVEMDFLVEFFFCVWSHLLLYFDMNCVVLADQLLVRKPHERAQWRPVPDEGCIINRWLGRKIRISGKSTVLFFSQVWNSQLDLRYSLVEWPLFHFQGVHSLLEGAPERVWGPSEKRVNKIVFIGKNLDESLLRKGFQDCLVPAKA